MRRWYVLAVGVAIGIVVTAFLGGIVVFRGGISARPEPSTFEAGVARRLRSWAIPSGARTATNPIPPSPPALAQGLAHFADHCAGCHANDGSGRTPIGRSLSPRAPDMRGPRTQGLTDGELFYIIENGVRRTGMPAWGGPRSSEGSWHLVHFIRHLPNLTAAEVARMETLNPKSPEEWRALEDEDAFLRGDEPEARPPANGGHAH